MTVHERSLSASIDPVKLDRLAELAIKVGLQLKAGQDLLVTAPTAALPLVRTRLPGRRGSCYPGSV
jgi:aminopeptidase